jgi:hypothetical protein
MTMLKTAPKLAQGLENFEASSEAEFYLPLPSGERVPVISSSRTLSGESPLQDHRVVTLIDISKQKDAEKQLREQYEFIVQMSDTVLHQALDLKNYSKVLEERVRERTERFARRTWTRFTCSPKPPRQRISTPAGTCGASRRIRGRWRFSLG